MRNYFYCAMLLILLSCSENSITQYNRGDKYGEIAGTIINGKKNGFFISKKDNTINEIEYFINDNIKERLKIFQGHIIEKQVLEKNEIVIKNIIDYEYYLKGHNMDYDGLQNEKDAGEKVYVHNCKSCHYKGDNTLFNDTVEATLLLKMINLKKTHNMYDKSNLLSQDSLEHQTFIHLDTNLIRCLSKYIYYYSKK